MLISIISATQINDEVWLVNVSVDGEPALPRMVPTSENPKVCPGGPIWCKQFGCELGVNSFTAAEPVMLTEEGKEAPTWDEVLGAE